MSSVRCPHCAAKNAEFNVTCSTCGVELDAASRSALPAGAGAELPAGTRVGKYVVDALIGQGGMGTVYRATDTQLRREVALKFLAADLARNPTAHGRFVREARAASALDHPHIGTVYEVGEHGGHPYFAMALYRGETLRAVLARGRLDAARAEGILRQLAQALAAAHAAGVIHRDLKPANVFLLPGDEVKLLDFGLAKLVSDGGESLTEVGELVGTVQYMSPEQIRGERVDGRADLWGLGVLGYEMLTGWTPFAAGTPTATMSRVLTGEPAPPSTAAPGVPARLEALILRLLAKARSDRPASAGEVLAALEGGAAVAPLLAAAPAVAAQRTSLPADPEATQWYLEGLARLRELDGQSARQLFERAAGRLPGHPLIDSALAEALALLGHDDLARPAAERAWAAVGTLRRREERVLVEGRYGEFCGDAERAVQAYSTLFDFFPENLDYGLRLAAAQTAAGRCREALATLSSLRALPPPADADPRIDIAEWWACETIGESFAALAAAERAAAAGTDRGARLLVARAYFLSGWTHTNLGDYARAETVAEKARLLFAEAGDASGESLTLVAVGVSHHYRGQYRASELAASAGLEIARRIGHRFVASAHLRLLSGAQIFTGRPVKGLATAEAAVAEGHITGNQPDIATAIIYSGIARFHLGQLEAAEADLADARAKLDAQGDTRMVAWTDALIGELLLARGDLGGARRYCEEGLALRQRIGLAPFLVDSRLDLARLAAAEENFAEAAALATGVIAPLAQAGAVHKQTLAEALLALAQVRLGQRDAARATHAVASARLDGVEDFIMRSRAEIALALTEAALGLGEAARLANVAARARLAGMRTLENEALTDG